MIVNFNLDKWNSFSKETQDQIAKACHDSVLWSYADNREQDVLAMKKAMDKGVQLKVMPEDVMREFNESALELYAKKAKDDPEVALVMESWKSWANEYGKVAPFVDYLDKTTDYFGQMIPYSEMKKRVGK